MSLTFDLHRNPSPASAERRAEIHANPGFGVHFTDHMLRAVWTKDSGWGQGRVEPYGPVQLMPSAAVLHYAQEIFEGLKAYRHEDGSVWSFRPEANAERMQRSARRLALPELPTDDFLASLRALVEVDEPGWATQLRFLEADVIDGLGMVIVVTGTHLAGTWKLRIEVSSELRQLDLPAPVAPAPQRRGATTPPRWPGSSRASSMVATRRSSSTPRRTPTSRSSAA